MNSFARYSYDLCCCSELNEKPLWLYVRVLSIRQMVLTTSDCCRRFRQPRMRFSSEVFAVWLLQRRPVYKSSQRADRQRNRIPSVRRALDSALSGSTHKRLSSLTWPSNWIGHAFSTSKSVRRRRRNCRAGGGRPVSVDVRPHKALMCLGLPPALCNQAAGDAESACWIDIELNEYRI